MAVLEDRSSSMTYGFGKRHIQMFLIFGGIVVQGIHYGTMPAALVSMTDLRDNSYLGPLNYSILERSRLLSMVSLGSTLGVLPAGWLANFHKPIVLMSSMVGVVCGIIVLVIPFIATQFIFAVICLTSLLNGVLLLDGSLLIRSLKPLDEPSGEGQVFMDLVSEADVRMTPVWWTLDIDISPCTVIGSLISTSLAGSIARHAGGWPSIFYFSGGVSIIWGVLAFICGSDSPNLHPTISIEEKDFIENNKAPTRQVKVDWKKMITSAPFWAIVITSGCDNWTASLITTSLPTYLKGVSHLSAQTVGFLSAAPYFSCMISSFLVAFIAGQLTDCVSVAVRRKAWTTLAFWGAASAFLLMYGAHLSFTLSIVCLTFAFCVNAGKLPGLVSNHYDVAPNLIGILSSMTHFSSSLVGSSGPIVMGYMISDEHDPQQWGNMFGVAAIVTFAGGLNFVLLASTDVQPWEKADTNKMTDIQKQVQNNTKSELTRF